MNKLIAAACILMPLSLQAGDLSHRFDLTLTRVFTGGPPFYTVPFVLADAEPRHERRFTEFSGDVSGRCIEALSVAAGFTGRRPAQLDDILTGVLKLQKPDGHWGDPFSAEGVANSDMALLWGNGRMLVGLMAAHRVAPDPQVLAAAVRLGDCLLALSPRLNTDAVQKEFSDSRIAVGYICWTQTIEGLVQLARATGEAKYRKLAEEIAARTERYPAQHSHGHVTALRGVLDLYRLTGDPKHLARVEREWEGILDSGNFYPQGALPEAFKPMMDRDEGCSESDWLRLNLELAAVTGNSRYLEHAERTLFNEFYFNQFSNGDFGHHTLTATGVVPPSFRAWWCCTFHGLRAFPDIMRSAFRAENSSLVYQIPVDGTGETEGLALRANSSLEKDAKAVLEVTRADEEERTVIVRIPGWAREVELRLNDRPLDIPAENERLSVTRTWSPGDRLTARYVLRTRIEKESDGRVRLYRGPWMLGVDNDSSPRFFDEPCSRNRIVLPAPSGSGTDIELEPAEESAEAGDLSFAVPVARCRLKYLPGGYPVQPQTALLRPLAEQTRCDDRTAWELSFVPKEK